MIIKTPIDWLKVLGIVGVIGSLIFVGFQLKQSQDIAIASQYQARLDSLIAVKGNLLQSTALITVSEKVRNGEPLDQFDLIIIDASVSQLYDLYESNHFQYASGFISEEHWQSVLRGMEAALDAFHMSEYWARNRLIYRASFAEIVDKMIAKKQAENLSDHEP